MRRVSVDCDGCDRKDVGEKAAVFVRLARKPGEMDGGAATVDLCHACAAHFLMRLVELAAKNAAVPCDEDFVKYVRDNRKKDVR